MNHSSKLGKLYYPPVPHAEDDAEDRRDREQEIVKSSWLRESPTLLANRIPNSVFALGDLAGQR